MVESKILIESTDGLHTRLAVNMVQAANKYSCDVRLVYEDKIVDLKSILGLMSLAIPQGKEVMLVAEGQNAELAIQDIMNSIK